MMVGWLVGWKSESEREKGAKQQMMEERNECRRGRDGARDLLLMFSPFNFFESN